MNHSLQVQRLRLRAAAAEAHLQQPDREDAGANLPVGRGWQRSLDADAATGRDARSSDGVGADESGESLTYYWCRWAGCLRVR